MCAWDRIPYLSENVSNAMRQSLELTNSLILERQIQMTAQSKKNEKNRNVIRGWYPSNFKVPKKDDTQPETLETRMKPNWKSTYHTEKVEVSQAGWPSGLGRQTQEIPQSRILVHECVRGFESHSCQKTFWTRWDTAFSRQILLHWNVNSRWQSQAENKKIAISSMADSWAVKKCKKRRYLADTCETRKYAWVWTQIFSNGWHKPFSRVHLGIEKIPNGKATNQNKCVDGNKAEWPSGLRRQAQENPQSRILVHECVRGFESYSCHKTFWTQ